MGVRVPNYYEILGVDRSAEQEVIDAAYLAMMRRYHPDTFTGLKAEGERRAKQLNEAYATLRDAERRRAYDETLGPAAPKTAPVREALANPNPPSARHRGLLIGGLAIAAVITVVAYANRQAPPAPIATASTPTAFPKPAPSPVAKTAPSPSASSTTLAACKGIDRKSVV